MNSTSHHDKNLKLIIFWAQDETITDVHSVGKFKILLNQMLSTKRSDDLTIHEYKQLCKEVENNIFKPNNPDNLKSILSELKGYGSAIVLKVYNKVY